MGFFGWLTDFWKPKEIVTGSMPGTPSIAPQARDHGARSSWEPLALPRYVVLDVETTGLSPQRNRILELALVTVDHRGRVLDEWATRVNPEGPVGATHTHGITAADVAHAPRFPDVLGEVSRRLAGAAVVAHNARFDLSFMRSEYERAGWRLPEVPCLCTLEASYYYLPDLPRRRLGDCCYAAGISFTSAHAALGDARATARLLSHFLSTSVAPVPRHADLVLPERAAQILWPREPTHQPVRYSPVVPPRRYIPTASPKVEVAPLVELVSRFSLEEAIDEGAHPSTLAYLEKVAEVLSDGILTEDESADLADLAAAHGLSEGDVRAANRAFTLALAHVAVEDGKVTRAERAELVHVSELLGLGASVVTSLLDRAERARLELLGNGLPPLPPGWQLGEPLRVGDKVAFTGCDEAERARLETQSESRGVRVVGSVSRRTAMLVADGSFEGTKLAAARQVGTRIVTPTQFAVLLRHLQPPAVSAVASTKIPSVCRPAVNESCPPPAESRLEPDPAQVRAWARARGIEVGDRGRLSAELLRAFTDANSSS